MQLISYFSHFKYRVDLDEQYPTVIKFIIFGAKLNNSGYKLLIINSIITDMQLICKYLRSLVFICIRYYSNSQALILVPG